MKNILKYFLMIILFLSLTSSSVLYSQEMNSEFINQSFPAAMDTGKKYTVMINMKNTGSTVWTASSEKGYKLSFVNSEGNNDDNVFGVGSILLNQNVEPGQSPLITFGITAPSKPGLYISQWRMMYDDQFFGEETKSIIVKVAEENSGVERVNDATLVKQNAPKIMKSKFRSIVAVTVKNSGNTKWVPGKFSLALVDDKMQPLGQNPWGISTIKLPDTVLPGATVTFKFQVTVPDQTGNYELQFAMMEGTMIFGDPFPVMKISVQN